MKPDHHQQAARQKQAADHAGIGEGIPELGDLIGREQAGGQAAEHGQAAKGGNRDDVDVAFPGLLQCAHPPGHTADQRGQQIGDRRCH